jgi:non-specific serine/threonine protein kinase
VADARQWLLRAYVRLLTFTGPAGVGKTRLALEVAAQLQGEFEDGAFFVDLSTLTDPGLVLPTIAQALGVRDAPGRTLFDRVASMLRERRLLLVLDNFEHVIEAAPRVVELLAACPGLKLLITSREVLRVSWEQDFPVTPLGLPLPGRLPPPEALAQVPAVEFFLARARAVSPGFTLTSENAAAVAGICTQLDGLPLAIELAAARVKVLSPAAILERLQSRRQVLAMGLRDLPVRQQTLQAAIDWSHELLLVDERALLRRLSVFAGGFTLEAAEAVASGTEVGEGHLLNRLTRLLDKSLILRDGHEPRSRYRLLETVRQYAEQRLRESGEMDGVRSRHLEWCLNLAERAEPELQGRDQPVWLDLLEQEHDNFRAALGWSLETDAVDGALRLAGALWGFWYVRGYWTEGRRWLENVMGAPTGASGALRAKAANALGVLLWAQGEYDGTAERCEEAAGLCRATDDSAGLAFSLNLLGLVMRHRGDHGRAAEMLEESLTLRRALGDTWGVASSLSSLGILASHGGDYGRATRLLEESLALRRQLGDRGGIAECFYFLGIVRFHERDHRRAAAHFEQCLRLFRELGDRSGIASSLLNLGMVAQYLGHSDRATRQYSESLSLRHALGDRLGVAECFERLAELAHAQGQHKRAARLAGAVDVLRDRSGQPGVPSPSGEPTAEQAVHVAEHVQEAGRQPAAGAARRAEAGLAAARTEGRAMSLEQAVQYALAVEPSAAPASGKSLSEPAGSPLTRREAEIAALVARGLTNRQIAQTFVITEGTAANHVQHILNKLGFDSRAQIAAWAAERGLGAPSHA